MLDTNVVTAFEREDRNVLARAKALPDSEIFVTVVSLQEQMVGRLARLNQQLGPEALVIAYRNLAQTFGFFANANVLPYDDRAARIDDDLRVRLRRMGTKDRRIAAITLAHGHTLVTRNTIDFRDVPGLGLEDWMAS